MVTAQAAGVGRGLLLRHTRLLRRCLDGLSWWAALGRRHRRAVACRALLLLRQAVLSAKALRRQALVVAGRWRLARCWGTWRTWALEQSSNRLLLVLEAEHRAVVCHQRALMRRALAALRCARSIALQELQAAARHQATLQRVQGWLGGGGEQRRHDSSVKHLEGGSRVAAGRAAHGAGGWAPTATASPHITQQNSFIVQQSTGVHSLHSPKRATYACSSNAGEGCMHAQDDGSAEGSHVAASMMTGVHRHEGEYDWTQELMKMPFKATRPDSQLLPSLEDSPPFLKSAGLTHTSRLKSYISDKLAPGGS